MEAQEGSISDGDGRTWRLCIRRSYLEEGMRALFVSYDALLPVKDDFLAKLRLHRKRYGW